MYLPFSIQFDNICILISIMRMFIWWWYIKPVYTTLLFNLYLSSLYEASYYFKIWVHMFSSFYFSFCRPLTLYHQLLCKSNVLFNFGQFKNYGTLKFDHFPPDLHNMHVCHVLVWLPSFKTFYGIFFSSVSLWQLLSFIHLHMALLYTFLQG